MVLRAFQKGRHKTAACRSNVTMARISVQTHARSGVFLRSFVSSVIGSSPRAFILRMISRPLLVVCLQYLIRAFPAFASEVFLSVPSCTKIRVRGRYFHATSLAEFWQYLDASRRFGPNLSCCRSCPIKYHSILDSCQVTNN